LNEQEFPTNKESSNVWRKERTTKKTVDICGQLQQGSNRFYLIIVVCMINVARILKFESLNRVSQKEILREEDGNSER